MLDDGYLEEEHFESEQAGIMAQDACDFNLAQNCLQFGQAEQALELFEQCHHRRPDIPRFAIAAARCHLALQQTDAARHLIEQALQHGVPAWYGAMLHGQVFLAEGNPEAALEQFFLCEAARPQQAGIHVQIGEVYVRLGRTEEAQRAFRKELLRDEESSQAHLGLGKIALASGGHDDALKHLLKSAALKEVNPEVHFSLARTLFESEKHHEALRAVNRALQQSPNLPEALELRVEITRGATGMEEDLTTKITKDTK